jgi:hypothetical protein
MTEKKQLTAAEQNHNYMTNTARIIGFLKGNTEFLGAELKRGYDVWTKEEIGDKLIKAVAVADLWFEKRYEGTFTSDDIKAMMEEKPSDIVELERAEK